ncbi:unnamed protein product, partial [Effrenium voratum]
MIGTLLPGLHLIAGRLGYVQCRLLAAFGQHGKGFTLPRTLPTRRPHTARRAAESAENQTDQDPPDTEAGVLAWLEERTGTPEGLEIGTMLFLSKERERLAAAEEALVLTREMLADSEKVADAMFLALYIRAAQVGTWLGADAWPASFLSKA